MTKSISSNRIPSSAPIATCTVPLVLALVCLLAARVRSAPTLDANFKPVITRLGGFGSAVAVQTDGKIIVAGGFNAVNGVARNGLARLNSDGTVDPAFEAGAICCGFNAGGGGEGLAAVSAVAIQPDGKILIGGSFTNVGGVKRTGLARLNSNGSLDTTFDPGSGLASTSLSGTLLPVVTMVVQPDGKVLVGGYFTAVNGVPRSGLVRINPDGGVDTSFDPGTALSIGFPDFGPMTGLALLPNGQIMVAGAFQAFGDVKRNGLARLNANGSLDHSFAPATYIPGAVPSIDGLAVQDDGGILISGSFTAVDDDFRTGLARLKPDGKVDLSFNPNVDTGISESYTVLGLQPGGKLIAFRQFNDPDGNLHRVIARLNADGTLDSSFNLELAPAEAGRLQVRDVAFQADGTLVLAGSVSVPNNATIGGGIVKANSTGGVDAAFNPQLELAEGSDGNVLAVAAQSDGKVVVGGSFTRINGIARHQVARVNADGSVDATFAPVLQSDQLFTFVAALAVQSDGKILIGGLFTSVNNVNRNSIARLNADGSLDTSFDPGSGTGVNDPAGQGAVAGVAAIALQPDGKVLVAGDFTSLNGQSGPYLARLNSNGTVDIAFSSGVGTCFLCDPPDIRSLGVLDNGLIMVSGVFNRVDVFFINSVTRLQQDGSVDLSLKPPITTEEQVTAMAVGKDGKATVAIAFPDATASEFRTRFLRFNLDGTVDASFKPDTLVGEGSTAAPVSALTIDAQGRMLIAGQFASIGGVPRRGLARLNVDGTLESGFDAGAGFGNGVFPLTRNRDSLVTGLALQSDGGIIVGGAFGTADNQVRLGLVRFQADSTGGPTGGDGARLTGLVRSANGAVSMLVAGEAGRSYRIEASVDLRTWTAVGTVIAAVTAQSFSDSGSGSFPQRFYRAVSP